MVYVEKMEHWLSEKSWIGVLALCLAWLKPYLIDFDGIVSTISSIVLLAIGVFTLIGKVQEYKDRKKKKRDA